MNRLHVNGLIFRLICGGQLKVDLLTNNNRLTKSDFFYKKRLLKIDLKSIDYYKNDYFSHPYRNTSVIYDFIKQFQLETYYLLNKVF